MTEQIDTIEICCRINGSSKNLTGISTEPATKILRDLGLLSVRETCSLGVCGSCTVLLDGEPVSTCILPFFALDGKEVTTVEGLETDGQLNELQTQFIESQAFQCSFCTPGFLMSGQALLDGSSGELSRTDIEAGLQGHLCRCGCYAAITEALTACSQRRVATGTK